MPKAVVEGERVNTERKREKERDRERETFIASGGFRRFLSFSLNNKKKKRQKKRIREILITLDVGEAPGREKRRGSQHHFRERKRYDEYSRKQSKRYKRPG